MEDHVGDGKLHNQKEESWFMMAVAREEVKLDSYPLRIHKDEIFQDLLNGLARPTMPALNRLVDGYTAWAASANGWPSPVELGRMISL